ncbi:hypothetical protein [Methanopyrus kandleri]|uniref:Uncharacterized protein n=1 Tax=Methanopyrus kandleri (strain AV19 / DSM 6324 / JCM 9639 / NBRC 100938) TaxID=190192 RepID=Q8TVT6_METKA|nr:hypothetical protein [Methanopyrus kandleri]AAM02515.1 Uncharacterized protein MK1302 [Methanopyrus kandleri AV19]
MECAWKVYDRLRNESENKRRMGHYLGIGRRYSRSRVHFQVKRLKNGEFVPVVTAFAGRRKERGNLKGVRKAMGKSWTLYP